MDLTSTEEMQQEFFNAIMRTFPKEIGQAIYDLVNDTWASDVSTDLTIECRLPSWQKSVESHCNKDLKHTHRNIGLSLRYKKDGRIPLKLYERNGCSLHHWDAD